MYKILVFEGLPASGKTTLINTFRETMAGEPQPLIIDRFFYSAMVYDFREGRGRAIEMEEFYKFIKQWGVLVVFVDTAPEVCVERDNARPKWRHYKLDELTDMRATYINLFEMYPLPMMRVDGADSAKKSVHQIMERLDKYEQ